MSEAGAPARTGALPERWRELDRSGPRYTSYPTAVEFHAGVGESDYARHLEQADGSGVNEGLSLYVHLPFCEKLCTFCACHFIATPHREVARRYLDTLEREIELLAERLPRRRELVQLSWGGGTPTRLRKLRTNCWKLSKPGSASPRYAASRVSRDSIALRLKAST